MSVRMYVGSAVIGVPQKNRTSVWSSNPIIGFIYLRPKGGKISMLISTSHVHRFILTKLISQSECLPVGEQMKKIQYKYTVRWDSAISWGKPCHLRQCRQAWDKTVRPRKQILHDVVHIWNLKSLKSEWDVGRLGCTWEELGKQVVKRHNFGDRL